MTVLMLAASYGAPKTVLQVLLAGGADWTATDFIGMTALDWAHKRTPIQKPGNQLASTLIKQWARRGE